MKFGKILIYLLASIFLVFVIFYLFFPSIARTIVLSAELPVEVESIEIGRPGLNAVHVSTAVIVIPDSGMRLKIRDLSFYWWAKEVQLDRLEIDLSDTEQAESAQDLPLSKQISDLKEQIVSQRELLAMAWLNDLPQYQIAVKQVSINIAESPFSPLSLNALSTRSEPNKLLMKSQLGVHGLLFDAVVSIAKDLTGNTVNLVLSEEGERLGSLDIRHTMDSSAIDLSANLAALNTHLARYMQNDIVTWQTLQGELTLQLQIKNDSLEGNIATEDLTVQELDLTDYQAQFSELLLKSHWQIALDSELSVVPKQPVELTASSYAFRQVETPLHVEGKNLAAEFQFEPVTVSLEQLNDTAGLVGLVQVSIHTQLQEVQALLPDQEASVTINKLVANATTDESRIKVNLFASDIAQENQLFLGEASVDGFVVSDLEKMEVKDAEGSIELKNLNLLIDGLPAQYAGLKGQWQLKGLPNNTEAGFQGTYTSILSDALPIDAKYNLQNENGTIEIKQLKTDIERLTPFIDHYAELLNPIALQSGIIESDLIVRLNPLVIESQGSVKKGQFAYEKLLVNNVNVKNRLHGGIENYQLDAEITIESVELPIDSKVEDISFAASQQGEVYELKNLQAKWLDGEMRIASATYREEQVEAFICQLKRLSLEKLFAVMEVDGLSGFGRIDMSLPIAYSEELTVNNGTFTSEGKGIIIYNSPGGAALAEQNIALQALSNFHYDQLTGSVNYNKKGEYAMKIRLVGKNPDVLDGYPIALNLNINGALPKMFRAIFLTGDLSENILQEIKAGQ